MSINDVMDDLSIFIVAGHETTAHAMSLFLYCMATNKNIENEARQEVDKILGERRIPEYDDIPKFLFLKNCVYESMRMFPIVPKNFRVLTSDQEVGKYKIPAGTHFWCSIYSMNRNPKYWENPEKISPRTFQ